MRLVAQTRRFLAASSLPALVMGAALLVGTGAAQAEPEFVRSVKPGPGVYELVFSAPMNRVYVAAAGTRGSTEAKVLALDPATLETKETIDFGSEAAFGLGINNKTKKLYATQTRIGAVAIVDLATGKVVATVKKGDKAHVREAVVDEAGNRTFITVMGRDDDSSVWIIDGATDSIVGSIDNLPGSVTGVAVDQKGNRLFASAMKSNQVHVIDLATGKIIKSFASGGENAINLVYDASGDQIFVAHQGSGDVVVLDAKDGSVVKKIPTGQGALGITLDAARNLVYVANRVGGYVTLIDTKTLEPVANVVTGSMPNTVAVDPATGNAYVTNKSKMTPRPRPAQPPAAGAAPAPGATPATPVAAAPAGGAPAGGAPGGPAPGGRPVPMIDPFGDTVSLIKP
ncbi:YncE family protein [Ancylobacter sp. Lp-2]|uniref:YncE family protein n=1 Tax=Ancylobacter sp. Lp-2 TaxID=2881339 RepID=UPI001E4C84AD|nr:YncE family protein [Ancylobacter sp. Lp-2]MCB4771670.1 YncE family protein [Ancylobacter sp. Lp-2]